ncbi:MAG TPA: hypothetical protein PLO89_01240 [Spirochaetota bacterium]|nr:hypothetical protein [Spirochaetota bacterium]
MRKRNKLFIALIAIFTLTLLFFISILSIKHSGRLREKKISKDISNIIWQFGRKDGSIISNKLILSRNGRINGSDSYNETYWQIDSDKLVFLNGNKQKTTEFDIIEKKYGIWKLEGEFLYNASIIHSLIEVERNDLKLFYFIIALLLFIVFCLSLKLNFKIKFYKPILSCIFLFFICLTIFSYSLDIRKPYFNRTDEWLSGATIKFVNMWYRENPFKIGFGMFFNPASVEFKNLSERQVYSSYPAGSLVPLYLMGFFNGKNVDFDLLRIYNLLNHFFIGFLLSLIIFLILKKINVNVVTDFSLSVIPPLLYFLLPPTLYWHQNVFFTDQAVILPFALIVFIELLKDCKINNLKVNEFLKFLSALTVFYGVSTDWFFCIIVLALYFKKIINFEFGSNILDFIKRSFFFFIPTIAAILLFLAQALLIGGMKRLINIFLFRTGLDGNKIVFDFYRQFWKNHIEFGFGNISLYLIFGSLLAFILIALYLFLFYFLKKRKISDNVKIIFNTYFLLSIPCFIQVYLLSNHSVIHPFSILKFAVPISIIPFVLCWISFFYLFFCDIKNESSAFSDFKIINFIAPFAIFCALFYLSQQYQNFRKYYPREYDFSKEKFINENVGYNDIVFSTNFAITPDPPQYLAVSEKRVYRISSIDEIFKATDDLKNENFTVNLIVKNGEEIAENLSKIIINSDNILKNKEYTIYKINKAKFNLLKN